MKKAPIPEDEQARLKKLHDYEILDTPFEAKLDQITEAVASVCGAKIALISLIDAERQWFKSSHGLNARETTRDVSLSI